MGICSIKIGLDNAHIFFKMRMRKSVFNCYEQLILPATKPYA